MNKNTIIVLAIAVMILIAVLVGMLIWLNNDQSQTAQPQPTQGTSLEKSPNPKIESSVALKPSTPINSKMEYVLMSVSFTPQAPLGNWGDLRQEDGCEEASALMAMYWVYGKTFSSPISAEKEIVAISDYELKAYGVFEDTSAEDTAKRIFGGYFHYNDVAVRHNISSDDIKSELLKGSLVIVPVNGQKLKNPYYQLPGPLHHNIVIKGYDSTTKEFITNDPGTRHGESYRYSETMLMGALQDYSTSSQTSIFYKTTSMIVVSKK